MNPLQGQGSINNPSVERVNIDESSSLNAVTCDVQHINGWSTGESSSGSGSADRATENGTKVEQGLPFQGFHAHAGCSRLDERHPDPNSICFPRGLHIGRSSSQVRTVPLVVRGSSSNHMQIPNLNSSAEAGQSSGATNGGPSYATSSHVLEGTLGGGGSSSGVYGLSCKRKAFEGTSGQSSSSTSTGCTTQPESGVWLSGAAQDDASSGLRISVSSQNSPTIYLPEQSARDFGMRASLVRQPELVHVRSVPVGSLGNGSGSSQQQLPAPVSLFDTMESEPQPNAAHSHLSRSVNPSTWSGPALSRTHDLLPAEGFGEPREDLSTRTIQRNNLERPMFGQATESRNEIFATDIWGPSIGTSADDRFGIPTRMSSSARNLPSAAWAHNPQQLPDFAPWSLFPSVASHPSSGSLPVSPAGASTDPVMPPRSSNQSHRQRARRSSLLLERQGEDSLRLPHLYRNIATDFQGRSRLISEIRQVLDAMSRGENLRIEDYMLFDPLVYHGTSDVHDRHRDMRLDVDNMSYEDLLALEERIGDVSTGLSEEVILRVMKQHKFAGIRTQSITDTEPCCICQEEYSEGDGMGTLECGHHFHTDCIKQWLMQKNLCPICKTTALNP